MLFAFNLLLLLGNDWFSGVEWEMYIQARLAA